MSYEFYKLVHFFGIFMLVLAWGGLLTHMLMGQAKQNPARRFVFLFHGLGLLFSLVGGFGLLARLGTGFQHWVYLKLGIWLLLGVLIALAYRKQQLAKIMVVVILALAASAAFLATNKPTF